MDFRAKNRAPGAFKREPEYIGFFDQIYRGFRAKVKSW